MDPVDAIRRSLHGLPPQLAKDFIAGLAISTVNSYDAGWETAIAVQGDHFGWRVVERYDTVDDARAGHARWLEAAPTLTKVTDIGLPGWTEPKEVELRRSAWT